MTYNNFYYGLSLLDTLYGISLTEDLYEEIALTGWELIGNKRSRLYRYKACLLPCLESLELPCNCSILESITSDSEDFLRLGGVEEYIENGKRGTEPLYTSGGFTHYERVGNTLYFPKLHNGGNITILYKGLVLDEDGLPEITDKEAQALATYCAWVTKFKEGLMTNNVVTVLMALSLLKMWSVKCDLARTDHEYTQNDWNEILDARANWDRKVYNVSLKPIR